METLIAKLLQDFEQGKMNRRQLISSLSVAAAAASVPTTVLGAEAPKPTGKLTAGYVNHISYSCNDYAKVRDFYVNLLGMKPTQDDGMQCRLEFGNNILIPRNRAKAGRGRCAAQVRARNHPRATLTTNGRRYCCGCGLPALEEPLRVNARRGLGRRDLAVRVGV